MTPRLEDDERSRIRLRERVVLAVLVLGAFAALFVVTNEWNARTADQRALVPEIPLDAYIPFLPSFVFAYALYYVWLVLPFVLLHRREHLYQTVIAYLLLEVPALVTFIALPTRMNRPPIADNGVAAQLVAHLYALDPGFNLLPSLHAGHAVLVALIFHAFRHALTPWIAAGAGAICLSTVFVKQHVVLDVPAGAALALIARVGMTPLYDRWVTSLSAHVSSARASGRRGGADTRETRGKRAKSGSSRQRRARAP